MGSVRTHTRQPQTSPTNYLKSIQALLIHAVPYWTSPFNLHKLTKMFTDALPERLSAPSQYSSMHNSSSAAASSPPASQPRWCPELLLLTTLSTNALVTTKILSFQSPDLWLILATLSRASRNYKKYFCAPRAHTSNTVARSNTFASFAHISRASRIQEILSRASRAYKQSFRELRAHTST